MVISVCPKQFAALPQNVELTSKEEMGADMPVVFGVPAQDLVGRASSTVASSVTGFIEQ